MNGLETVIGWTALLLGAMGAVIKNPVPIGIGVALLAVIQVS